MIKKILLFFIVTLLSISIFACNKTPEPSEDKPENSVVAIVNGTEILLFDLFEVYRSMNVSYMNQGIDITDDEITSQILEEALDTLIAYELLFQNAVKNGYSASQDEINQQIDMIKSEYETEKEFIDSLDQQKLTLATLKDKIEKEMLISDYVQGVIGDPEVLEEEIMEMYEKYKEQTEEDVPDYAELKAEIEQKLKSNKFSEGVSALINNLKSESEIEIFRETPN